MLILYLNWIIFQLYLNCSKICKNYQALFDFIISVKWANKCKTYNNSCKNCQALSFSPSPYLREIAGTKINFHTTPPHYTTGNFLRNNVNDVFTPMPSISLPCHRDSIQVPWFVSERVLMSWNYAFHPSLSH